MTTRNDDYTLFPQSVADCMARAGVPLTDEQWMCLCGYLASFQMSVANQGYDAVMDNIRSSQSK